jgi:hypothetical protein
MNYNVTLFHTRFGGSVSIEQELEDLTDHLPRWLRPIWKLVLPLINRWIRKAKIARTMAVVDKQAEEIKQMLSTSNVLLLLVIRQKSCLVSVALRSKPLGLLVD